MLHIILFGPPGSGKGTQAVKLAEAFDLLHVSTGDLFRAEMSAGTPLGLEAKAYIGRGELVPDDVTIGMLQNRLHAGYDHQGVILDGFPRNVYQAEALDRYLASVGQVVTALIALQVGDEEIVDRIKSRARTSGRADDTDETIIRNRIAVYKQETAPVFAYYEAQGRAVQLDGVGDIAEIFDRLSQVIKGLGTGAAS